jgi:hypothetical protein
MILCYNKTRDSCILKKFNLLLYKFEENFERSFDSTVLGLKDNLYGIRLSQNAKLLFIFSYSEILFIKLGSVDEIFDPTIKLEDHFEKNRIYRGWANIPKVLREDNILFWLGDDYSLCQTTLPLDEISWSIHDCSK